MEVTVKALRTVYARNHKREYRAGEEFTVPSMGEAERLQRRNRAAIVGQPNVTDPPPKALEPKPNVTDPPVTVVAEETVRPTTRSRRSARAALEGEESDPLAETSSRYNRRDMTADE